MMYINTHQVVGSSSPPASQTNKKLIAFMHLNQLFKGCIRKLWSAFYNSGCNALLPFTMFSNKNSAPTHYWRGHLWQTYIIPLHLYIFHLIVIYCTADYIRTMFEIFYFTDEHVTMIMNSHWKMICGYQLLKFMFSFSSSVSCVLQ